MIVKSIFGSFYGFEATGEWLSILERSLLDYDDAGMVDPCVVIRVVETIDHYGVVLSKNPKIFTKYADGSFVMSFPHVDIKWSRNPEGQIFCDMAVQRMPQMWSALRLLRSIEFPSPVEAFEQALHELVLVPSTYFLHDRVPVHAAAIGVNGRAILLAGTGGVGKSSALLALRKDACFISDDVAIVSSDGQVYGNMAWPKVYGYNCSGNPILEEELLKGRGFWDRLHYRAWNSISPARIRRKVPPAQMYPAVIASGSLVSDVYYVVRSNCSAISVADVDAAAAMEMSLAVIQAEYSIMNNFILWDRYNSIALDVCELLNGDRIESSWRATLSSFFEKARIRRVEVPLEMENSQYQREIREIVLEA